MIINTVENKRMKMAMLNSRQIFMLQCTGIIEFLFQYM